MAKLYVEDFPEDVCEALRAQAKPNRRSIAAETISLLESTLPTSSELPRRLAFYRQVRRIRPRQVNGPEGPPAEDLLRGPPSVTSYVLDGEPIH
jgi:plasmid stability protein